MYCLQLQISLDFFILEKIGHQSFLVVAVSYINLRNYPLINLNFFMRTFQINAYKVIKSLGHEVAEVQRELQRYVVVRIIKSV